MTTLWLENNGLGGTIPTQIGLLTKLETLYLSQNQLTVTVPSELGNLASMKLLYLFDNKLSGPLAPGLDKLTNLQRFKVDGNAELCGTPPTFGQQLLTFK